MTELDTSWMSRKPYEIEYLFHITPIENIKSIHNFGLHSRRCTNEEGYTVKEIANPDVLERREPKMVRMSGRPIPDYVPLFFTPWTPMMRVKKDMQNDIAILCVGRKLLLQKGVIFTDGNAASNRTAFFNDLRFIDCLDWSCIRDPGEPIYLNSQQEFDEFKRKRAAEVLVPDWISFSHVQNIVVKSQQTFQKLYGPARNIAKVDPRFYLGSDLRFHFDN